MKEKAPVVNELLRVAQAGNMQTTTDAKTVAGETGAYLDSSEETHDVMKQVAAMRNLQLACKWAGGRILKENLDSLTTAITNKTLMEEISAVLMPKLPTELKPSDAANFVLKLPKENADLKNCLNDIQYQMLPESFAEVTVTPFCLPEVLCNLSGDFFVAGVPSEKVAGDAVTPKLSKMSQMTGGELQDNSKDDGFIAHMQTGDVLAIPAGMLVIKATLDSHGADFLRWGLLPASSKGAVHRMLNDMLQAFDLLQSTDYKTLSMLLDV